VSAEAVALSAARMRASCRQAGGRGREGDAGAHSNGGTSSPQQQAWQRHEWGKSGRGRGRGSDRQLRSAPEKQADSLQA
jgi:hypothetical protein